MNAKPLTALGILLASGAWLDQLEQGMRILSAAGAILAIYFAIRAHISKKKLTDFQLKKEQEAIKIKSNGHAK